MKIREQLPDSKPLYAAMTAAELLSRPPKEWTIPGMLPATGVAAIYGATNVGKTFIALELLAAIAEGGQFFGNTAKARGVVYVGLEGSDGIAARVRAWSTHHGRPLPDRARFILEEGFGLDNDKDVEHLAKSIAALHLDEHPVIFIDTLSAAMMGLEENSSADMGGAMKRIRHLRKLTDGMIILIAHSGKDSAKGLRGSSKLPADCDTIFQLKKKAGKRSLVVEKQRDAKVGDEWTFELLEVAGEGDVASCVVTYEMAGGAHANGAPRPLPKPAQERLGPNERIVVEIVRSYGGQGVRESEALSAFKAQYKPGSRHATTRFTEAVARLVEAGCLVREVDHLRLP
ncbi:AAA family ATPase [Variovorax sp. J2P1-59]|uniref:AAA family ATPase n=1 Tax=Variovorax flavidus TaxID=3053501 RepID=UPI0025774943|nr:AAA family ATPase [Variovorax sp. J2P1-59]MDM0076879.1 AAA family ATPase [Variovorax sp. J2P1-59]